MVSRVLTDPNTSVIDCHHSPCIGPLYCSHLDDNKSISTPLDSSSTTPCYLYEYITQLIKLKDLQKHDSYHKKKIKRNSNTLMSLSYRIFSNGSIRIQSWQIYSIINTSRLAKTTVFKRLVVIFLQLHMIEIIFQSYIIPTSVSLIIEQWLYI